MAASGSLITPSIIGAVLVGGASRRFSGSAFGDNTIDSTDKAAIIGPHVLATMRAASVDPIVAIGGTPGVLPVPTVADRYPGEGPLGALATAATFARTGWFLTATCDLPLLSATTLVDLITAVDPRTPDIGVVACVEGQPQVSLGIWPAAWGRALHRSVRAGERRFQHVLTLGETRWVEVPPEDLQDADDQATLAALWSPRTDMADPEPPGA